MTLKDELESLTKRMRDECRKDGRVEREKG